MIVFRCFILTAKTDGMDYFRTVFLKKELTELPYGIISTPFSRFFSAE